MCRLWTPKVKIWIQDFWTTVIYIYNSITSLTKATGNSKSWLESKSLRNWDQLGYLWSMGSNNFQLLSSKITPSLMPQPKKKLNGCSKLENHPKSCFANHWKMRMTTSTLSFLALGDCPVRWCPESVPTNDWAPSLRGFWVETVEIVRWIWNPNSQCAAPWLWLLKMSPCKACKKNLPGGDIWLIWYNGIIR